MADYEKKLSKYVDQLNREKIPKEHEKRSESASFEHLIQTVRMVRSLKEPVFPQEDYHEEIAAVLKGEAVSAAKERADKKKRTVIMGAAVIAALVFLIISMNTNHASQSSRTVASMDLAMTRLRAYHATLVITRRNELGEETIQGKREIWADQTGRYYIKELTGNDKDQITVNNGKEKWQQRPSEKRTYIFAAFPDTYHFTFELQKEMEEVKNALSVEKSGEEMIAGRKATLVKVIPKAGEPYQLWLDQETDLPLQKLSAMQNSIGYKYTFTSIEYTDVIPSDLLAYHLPNQYEEVDTNPEQFVASCEEAESLTGFYPAVLEMVPQGFLFTDRSVLPQEFAVKSYYQTSKKNKTVIVTQRMAEEGLKPKPDAALGMVNDQKAEMRISNTSEENLFKGQSEENGAIATIRWQEKGYEYEASGNVSMETLSLFAGALSGGEVSIPLNVGAVVNTPQFLIPVDMGETQEAQKSVDEGHSPWKLDPVFVTQVFASLLLSPEGITGEYPVAYNDITILSRDKSQAIAEIKNEKSIAKYVYLNRLIRQDNTGIWSVTGYDGKESVK